MPSTAFPNLSTCAEFVAVVMVMAMVRVMDPAVLGPSQTIKRKALCCAVLCCAVLCCAVLCCAVLCGAALAPQFSTGRMQPQQHSALHSVHVSVYGQPASRLEPSGS